MGKFKFKVNDEIYKPKGYKFGGTIVSVFKTTAGENRVVAELDDNGMLHIFSESQLELRKNCKHKFVHGMLSGIHVSICEICDKKIWDDGLA